MFMSCSFDHEIAQEERVQNRKAAHASGGELAEIFSCGIHFPPHLSLVAQSTVRFSERRLLRQAFKPGNS
jgi:hypothetical protein